MFLENCKLQKYSHDWLGYRSSCYSVIKCDYCNGRNIIESKWFDNELSEKIMRACWGRLLCPHYCVSLIWDIMCRDDGSQGELL